MPSAGSPLYLQMETVDVQVVSTWRAVLVAFGSPQIPKRNWRIWSDGALGAASNFSVAGVFSICRR